MNEWVAGTTLGFWATRRSRACRQGERRARYGQWKLTGRRCRYRSENEKKKKKDVIFSK